MAPVFHSIDSFTEQSAIRNPVLTIGNFDGVHQGHRQLLLQTIEKARALKTSAVALTFNPHPQMVLKMGKVVPFLLTYAEKIAHLNAYGLDAVIEEPFVREFSNLSAENFFTDFLLKRIQAQAIVVGYDFGFGKEREGSQAVLKGLCEKNGIDLQIVHPHQVDGLTVSSTAIRKALEEADLAKATLLLGYPFYYQSVVVRGEQRGRTIGFPTANQKVEQKMVLPYGVYATRTLWKGKEYPSVTNIGVRPTFHAKDTVEALIETHLLDQTVDLYGSTIRVQFIQRLRGEQKFAGIDALKAQIQKDVEEARCVMSSKP